ncbi:WD40-repeat-containing domain protein [Pisolithus marmoratus]|nr:WD40-repeat-containing domain protein [Pisolithus marmoratus]
MEKKTVHEHIDMENADLVCTGVRHIVRIERTPSPRIRKKKRPVEVIDLVGSDEDNDMVTSSSRSSVHTSHSSTLCMIPSQRDEAEAQRIAHRELPIRHAAERVAFSPSKRQANTTTIAALNMPIRPDLKRKAPTREEAIIILSDEESTTPVKRQKFEDSIPTCIANVDLGHSTPSPMDCEDIDEDLTDSDNECVNFMATLDISDETNWTPLRRGNKAEDLTPELLPLPPSKEGSSLEACVPQFRSVGSYNELPLSPLTKVRWSQHSRIYGITRYPKPFHPICSKGAIPLSGCTRSRKLYYDLAYDKLGLIAEHPHLTSGAITSIAQAPGKFIVGATASAGTAEYSEVDQEQAHSWCITVDMASAPSWTRRAKLNEALVHSVQAHCHTRMTDRGPAIKYYSVNDVAFNPYNSCQFLSTGHDCSAKVWQISDDEESLPVEPSLLRTLRFRDVPEELFYKSDNSVLAVSCTDGTISLFSTEDIFEDGSDFPISLKQFRVAPSGTNQAAGPTTWGVGSTENFLFTSSEPPAPDDTVTGYHRAWDAKRQCLAFELDVNEAGDAIAVNPDGSTLVLTTVGPENSHSIRLYDIRRRNPNAYEKEELESFCKRPSSSSDTGDQLEQIVHCTTFSSDGRHLAIARSDNSLHVYDIRALSKGPLCDFRHFDSDGNGGSSYGVVHAAWVEGRDRRRIGIVSGGDDGCVRLWEPALSSSDDLQGIILGRSDFDVAHFSIGDGWKGEMPLVM